MMIIYVILVLNVNLLFVCSSMYMSSDKILLLKFHPHLWSIFWLVYYNGNDYENKNLQAILKYM